MIRCGAEHHHLVHALEGHDLGLDPDHRIGSRLFSAFDDAFEAHVAGAVKTSLNSFTSPRDMLLSAPMMPPAAHNGISDVAEDKLPGLEAAVELAIQFLPIRAGRESDGFAPLLILAMDTRSNGEEFDVAVEHAQFVGDAGDPRPTAEYHRLGSHSLVSLDSPSWTIAVT